MVAGSTMWGSVALPFGPAVGLFAGVGDLDVLTLEVVPIQNPVPLHMEEGHTVLVGLHVDGNGDGLDDLLGEPLGVPASPESQGVDDHIDVLDGLIDHEIPHCPTHDVDMPTDPEAPGKVCQERHEDDGLLVAGSFQVHLGDSVVVGMHLLHLTAQN